LQGKEGCASGEEVRQFSPAKSGAKKMSESLGKVLVAKALEDMNERQLRELEVQVYDAVKLILLREKEIARMVQEVAEIKKRLRELQSPAQILVEV
jgi:DNA polymerase sigma